MHKSFIMNLVKKIDIKQFSVRIFTLTNEVRVLVRRKIMIKTIMYACIGYTECGTSSYWFILHSSIYIFTTIPWIPERTYLAFMIFSLIKTTPSSYTRQGLTGIDKRSYLLDLYIWPNKVCLNKFETLYSFSIMCHNLLE